MNTYKKFDSNTTYAGVNHNPTQGQPGHGNAVKFDDGSSGRVIASNQNRSLVEYQSDGHTIRDWFPNEMLSISTKHIVAE